MEMIRSRLTARGGLEMTENRRKMAMMPQGGPEPSGTWQGLPPGIYLEAGGARSTW
ncbi:hypothetical protein [Thermogymnomonas acidicola]|uniref:hypothetical protein n=1 Tax=Thermogymnomonas acidicola TaxID=399579 RepID=UPI001494DB97|nr:hypothetical protein [Thermogymnomonas acidicola]